MPRSERELIRLALAGLLLAGAVACGHPLDNGFYTFTADGPPLKDTCGLAPDGGSLWDATLTTTGEEVFVHYNLAAPDQVQLSGYFKYPKYGAEEGFLVDGTNSQLPAPIPGVAGGCQADTLVVHLDATVPDAKHFTGLLQVKYAMTPPASGPCQDIQSCELEAHFKAEFQHR